MTGERCLNGIFLVTKTSEKLKYVLIILRKQVAGANREHYRGSKKVLSVRNVNNQFFYLFVWGSEKSHFQGGVW